MPRDVVSSCQFDVVIKVVKDSLYVMQNHGYTILPDGSKSSGHAIDIILRSYVRALVRSNLQYLALHFPVIASLRCPTTIVVTTIMHQHAGIGNIIGMVICDLEVIDRDRVFQDFMLNLLDDHVLAVDQDQDISRPMPPGFSCRVDMVTSGRHLVASIIRLHN